MLAQIQPGTPNSRFFFDPGPVWHSIWPPGRIERNRRIYDFELVYFANGRGRVATAAGVFECEKGTAVIIPPRLVHCTVADTQLERWCVHFDWFGDCRGHREAPRIFVYQDDPEPFREEFCARDPEFADLRFPFCRRHVCAGILPLLQQYFLPVSGGLGEQFARQGLLLRILGAVFEEDGDRENARSRESGKLFFRAKHIVDANCLRRELSVNAVAAECGVTPGHLTRLFHQSLGMPVSEYIQLKRLRRSRELLQDSTLTVREIAYACGFEDANYFSRFFRRKTGKTPAEFRRDAATGAEPMEI